ncbi:hypothetical protein COT64_03500 [Candidatus Shapirobacteria bacterium CG09_land_8_20_14_0_10_39_12]|uniref:Cell envelope-related transcriptional attenuator domain-containing protein n=2 Tax=Candidatus Shapironibacteriota TaxID=1752721 RepID=A0A2M8L537_9BACT|nr:MAG: hypothetical protein COT64_03500 [Candidatus Shapirobacteria bacterium CG09_land_8_20_14_0_10_39_12]PJE68949.1 MAG: hypothetical protein COU96_02410 [Candidatus Shapirobacteria bacterium CG10_big_fil_rev_8_21_14_0_10_38_14]
MIKLSSKKIFKLLISLFLVVFFLWVFYSVAFRWFRLAEGRTNILFLGIPGGAHAGKDLTDTLIFFSIDHQTGDSLMFSLPRDIWIDSMRAKINTAYHYGGLDLAKAVTTEVLGQPINYAVLLDFGGFIKIVDVLGGVEIEVENAFDDYKYPIPGKENDNCDGDLEYQCRYEHLHFDAGWQLMDGEKALKYVRSRYAEGDEGTDFARARRQQRLLSAFVKKLFSFETFSHPSRISNLIGILKQGVKTDILPENYIGLAKLALKFDSQKLRTEVLDFFVSPPASAKYDYHWVLIPRKDWQEIHQHVLHLLSW